MGGRKVTTDELWAQAEANGYARGAHTEVDQVRGGQKYVSKTKKDHDRTLQRYVLWHLKSMREDHARNRLPLPDEDVARSQYLGTGVPAPDLLTVKDFLRFYIATSKVQIDNDKPTVDSICTIAEWFFAGFTRVTGTDIGADDRSEVYYWIRRTLVLEGIVVNKHRPKHNFTVRDLTRVLLALWTYDDLIFIHERYRVQTTFLIHAYCWTGARINAFFTDGLRYKDVELILQRDPSPKNGNGWRLVYKIDQRWVKNNRDPENIAFGAAAKEHQRLFYNDAGFLLVMAITDGALFGYESLDDVRQQVIPAGKDELILRFKDSALGRPIVRKCNKTGGVTDDPMPRSAFVDVFKSTLVNAGYLWGLSIHAIRRQLGKGADRRNTTVERSQHLTQADPRVFGQSYVANCSSVDGQAAFRNKESDQRHIEYFQSLEKFHEDGLPSQLPAHLEGELEQDPRLRELTTEVQTLMGIGRNNQKFSSAKRQLTSYHKKLKREALRLYQESWVQQRRDWKVLTRGKEAAKDNAKTELAQSIYILFPERRRLAEKMASPYPMASDEMWNSLQDLHSLCLQDSDVLYLPGSQPHNGACPFKCCQRRMNTLPKYQRNQHIQYCVRQDMATRLGHLLADVNYCYLCFDWVVGTAWEPHCQAHLDARTSKRCGTVTHRHTLLRPAYSLFCINKVSLPASERLKPWSRDHKLWIHVEREHLIDCKWPLVCPDRDLLCNTSHKDTASFQFHLMDVHRYSRTPPGKAAKPMRAPLLDENVTLGGDSKGGCPGRKRKSTSSSRALEWTPPQLRDSIDASPTGQSPYSPRKRKRQNPPTAVICPEIIVIEGDTPDDYTTQSGIASVTLSPVRFPGCGFSGDCIDPKYTHFSSYNTTATETILEPADSEDGSDPDSLFDQYLRLPSLSPPPLLDDMTSQSSEVTSVHTDHDQSRNSTEPYNELSESPILVGTPEDQKDTDHKKPQDVSAGPRIRLRVTQPKITLRLKLQGQDRGGHNRKKRSKLEKGRKGMRQKRQTRRPGHALNPSM